MTIDFNVLVSSFTAIFDILAHLSEIKSIQGESKVKISKMMTEVMTAHNLTLAAQKNEMALLKTISQLEEEIKNHKAWDIEKEQYELNTIDGLAFVYVRKKSVKIVETPHWLCATCYQESKKSILQFKRREELRKDLWCCNQCSAEIRIKAGEHP